MSNRLFLIALLCALMVCPSRAATINENQARQVAANFMSAHLKNARGGSMRLAHKAPSINAAATSPYYVFNVGGSDDGFVIVAGDDKVPQVLGYSDAGSFDVGSIPEAMQELLDSYADQIAALGVGGTLATHINSARTIRPMVPAIWSQNSPFNTKLPFLSNGRHAYVGCVATAMAQVMYYWKYPQQSKSIPAYCSSELMINMPSLPAVNFDWDAMQNTYLTSDSLSVEGRAAAQLSLYCAQSVKMDFGNNSSSAYTNDVPNAMSLYFGYSPNASVHRRNNYTTTQWETMILDELQAGRPVIYSGRKESSGHAFVCDGYGGNGLFHINWGWNGNSNGYFLLSVLNPNQEGTGSAGGSYGYVSDQLIIAGIKPGESQEDRLEVAVRNIEVQDYQRARTSSSQDFTLRQVTEFINYMDDDIDFYYGWGLYQGDELVTMLDSGIKYGLKSWYYINPLTQLSFGSGIANGQFRILPMYKGIFGAEWKPCVGAGITYFEVNIDGNSCSIVGHGNGMAPSYQVNDIKVSGNMHPARPLDITLDVTNLGYTRNDVIYMFINDKFTAMGFVDLGQNERGNVYYRYEPEAAGTLNLKFTTDKQGTDVLFSHQVRIDPMPLANLTGNAKALNVTNATDKIIVADNFGVGLEVTNNSTETYDEDITVYLYKWVYDNRGSLVQSVSQHLVLAPQEKTTMTFHLDNVIDGWKYFVKCYYYSGGMELNMANVGMHSIVFPVIVPGDVNRDGEVSIADVNTAIDYILKNEPNSDGDVNGDGEVTVADVNAIINIILK